MLIEIHLYYLEVVTGLGLFMIWYYWVWLF